MHRTVSIIAASNLRVRKIREAGETVFALLFWFLRDPGPLTLDYLPPDSNVFNLGVSLGNLFI